MAQRSNLQIFTREVKKCNFYNFQVLIKNQPKNIYVSEMHQIKGNYVYYTNKWEILHYKLQSFHDFTGIEMSLAKS